MKLGVFHIIYVNIRISDINISMMSLNFNSHLVEANAFKSNILPSFNIILGI
jgi:hypothetical protein